MKRYIRSRMLHFCMALLSVLFVYPGCSDDNIIDATNPGWLKISPLELDFDASGGVKEIQMNVDVDVNENQISYSIAGNGKDWCSLEKTGKLLKVIVDPTYYTKPRATIIIFSYDKYTLEIPISQAASESSEDKKIAITSAFATNYEPNFEIEKTYDGDFLSYFNSKYGAFTDWPFIMEYTLESVDRLNYIQYHPRSDSGNKWGAFNKYSIYVSTEDAPDTYTKIGDYERGNANLAAHRINLDTPVEKPHKVKFEIWSAYENRISCAEMEFFQTNLNRFDYTKIFTDKACSQLRAGITEEDIKKMPDPEYQRLAVALLNNVYPLEFRIGEYRPYQKPAIMAGVNKTEHYSLRDNPTGIYVEPNDEIVVLVGNIYGQSISMVVQDLDNGYNSSKSYFLSEGENKIKVATGGLIYILNTTDDNIPLILETEQDKAKAKAKTVKVHFVFGKINGYFNSERHVLSDWTELLKTAKYKDIDVVGKRAHITWAVQDFRDSNTDIVSVLEKYDRLVYLEQEFMGLEKYNKMFNNRMYFHLDYNGASPYATRNRTAYTRGYAEIFCKSNRFEARLWGPSHEVGHINQTRPGLKWTGTTEVTNNIHSMYVQQQFGQPSKLLVDGFYQKGKEAIIDANLPHCQGSNEVKLVPFWQLKLYMIDALGKVDFYHDLYEYYRITPDLNTTGTTQGILQLDFVRQVCRISGLNMLDFFEKWGFLTPVDRVINDYGNKDFKITQSQIDALIKEINTAGYAQPKTDVHLITENNIGSYK